jgi:hypothetical protein
MYKQVEKKIDKEEKRREEVRPWDWYRASYYMSSTDDARVGQKRRLNVVFDIIVIS